MGGRLTRQDVLEDRAGGAQCGSLGEGKEGRKGRCKRFGRSENRAVMTTYGEGKQELGAVGIGREEHGAPIGCISEVRLW